MVRHPALFLDVDGTLLPIVARPEDVRVDADLIYQLDRLQFALHGACAILSGRSLSDLTSLFFPLKLPAAGIHGLERRRVDGHIVCDLVDTAPLDEMRQELAWLATSEPNLRIEDKGVALAAHFRECPRCEARIFEMFSRLTDQPRSRFHIQEGLFVLELKPRGATKGTALLDFMGEPEFAGRTPIAIGDDLTDVHAFRAAESLGGIGVAVGDRVATQWRIDDPVELRCWLYDLLDALN